MNVHRSFNVLPAPHLKNPPVDLSQLDPTNVDHRQLLLDHHPMKLRKYLIPTPALRTSLAAAVRLVDARMSGGAFVSNPRFGKSSAIDYLLAVIDDWVPGRAFVHMGARDRKRSDPTHTYVDVLEAQGSPLATKGMPDVRYERALKALWMIANERDADHLVTVVDEAQRYTASELDGLLALSNELYRRWGIRMTTLLWGQRSLEHQFTALSATNRTDLTGRFMPRMFLFRGVTSVGALAQILAALDDASEFPSGSGWSYVRLHFPHAVANGFRLADFAAPLWHAFLQQAHAYEKNMEVGMEWMSLALEDLIVSNACDDSDQWRPSGEVLEKAVTTSGFAQAIGNIYCPEEFPASALRAGGSDAVIASAGGAA